MNEMPHNDESQECAQMRRQFDLYELDLPVDDKAVGFEGHFKTCANCRSWLANWDLVKIAARKTDEVEVPLFVFDNIMSAISPVGAAVATPVASTSVSSIAPVNAPSRIYSSDLGTMLFGFGILILSFTIFASGSFDESLSWCISFILLIAFNQLTKAKTSLGVA